jgi:metal-responsive CopG/Arc/MetJ family transcriptional regulator
MGTNDNELNIISICLPARVEKDMKTALSEMGYRSRSELVRDAVRGFLKEKKKN